MLNKIVLKSVLKDNYSLVYIYTTCVFTVVCFVAGLSRSPVEFVRFALQIRRVQGPFTFINTVFVVSVVAYGHATQLL